MRLFWDRGYEGTTFDELTAAMGISPSSFHNSFGSKQRLYTEATDVYLAESARWFADTIAGRTDTREAFQALFEATAEAFTRGDLPAGCMISLAGTHVAPEYDPIREMMAAHRALSERMLKERLEQGIASGDLPADADTAALAAFFSALFRGMAVQARDGANRERLLEIGRVAMRAWPDRPTSRSPSTRGRTEQSAANRRPKRPKASARKPRPRTGGRNP
jgi:AcrR family transcriptional regulator